MEVEDRAGGHLPFFTRTVGVLCLSFLSLKYTTKIFCNGESSLFSKGCGDMVVGQLSKKNARGLKPHTPIDAWYLFIGSRHFLKGKGVIPGVESQK